MSPSSAGRVIAPTFEDALIDGLLARQGGRDRLRQWGDEDLHRADLALRRSEVLWEDALAEYGPERAVTYLLAISRARAALAEEEDRRERARFRGVPRDPAQGWVPDEIVAAIKRGVDLATLVTRWGLTDLRERAGGKWVGRCPWHDDDTPSFYVYTADPDQQHFHCFGCQAHGDVFDLARRHGAWLTFGQAVEGLATVAGVAWVLPTPPASPATSALSPAPARRRKGAAFFPR